MLFSPNYPIMYYFFNAMAFLEFEIWNLKLTLKANAVLSQELGEILSFKFVYFLICTVVDASTIYVQ
jgi:hypothetical protein